MGEDGVDQAYFVIFCAAFVSVVVHLLLLPGGVCDSVLRELFGWWIVTEGEQKETAERVWGRFFCHHHLGSAFVFLLRFID